MDMLHTTVVMAIFVIFLLILVKIRLPWQRPLDYRNQKCLIWIGRPRKPYRRTKNFEWQASDAIVGCREA